MKKKVRMVSQISPEFTRDSNRYYSVAQLSERISTTPEGYLICEEVPIARSGELIYQATDLPKLIPKDGIIKVKRDWEVIGSPIAIASFEGKPVTLTHPPEFVGPENWKKYEVGTLQNVRPGDGENADKLLADFLIKDPHTMALIRSNQIREVSCGYDANYEQLDDGEAEQTDIIGNHVALVDSGRCGAECAILDHASIGSTPKMTLKDRLLNFLKRDPDFSHQVRDYGTACDSEEGETMNRRHEDIEREDRDINHLERRIAELEQNKHRNMRDMRDTKDMRDMRDMRDKEMDMRDTDEMMDEDMGKRLQMIDKRLMMMEKMFRKMMKEDEMEPEDMEMEEEIEEEMEDEEEMDMMDAPEGPGKTAPEKFASGAHETLAEEEQREYEEKRKLENELHDRHHERFQDAKSRAEILAPGVSKTGDVKLKALKAAYRTRDGRTVIDSLLNGKSFRVLAKSAALKNMVFVGAAEVMKAKRNSKLNSQRSFDSLSLGGPKKMTPAKINEIHAAAWASRKGII